MQPIHIISFECKSRDKSWSGKNSTETQIIELSNIFCLFDQISSSERLQIFICLIVDASQIDAAMQSDIGWH